MQIELKNIVNVEKLSKTDARDKLFLEETIQFLKYKDSFWRKMYDVLWLTKETRRLFQNVIKM